MADLAGQAWGYWVYVENWVYFVMVCLASFGPFPLTFQAPPTPCRVLSKHTFILEIKHNLIKRANLLEERKA